MDLKIPDQYCFRPIRITDLLRKLERRLRTGTNWKMHTELRPRNGEPQTIHATSGKRASRILTGYREDAEILVTYYGVAEGGELTGETEIRSPNSRYPNIVSAQASSAPAAQYGKIEINLTVDLMVTLYATHEYRLWRSPSPQQLAIYSDATREAIEASAREVCEAAGGHLEINATNDWSCYCPGEYGPKR
jgi:hypothetical protein